MQIKPEQIKSWQRYLARKQDGNGAPLWSTSKIDGHWSPGLTQATSLFQTRSELSPTGEINFETARLALRDSDWTRVWLSPVGIDLRRLRPYFMVPLLESAFPFEHDVIREDIRQSIRLWTEPKVKDGKEVAAEKPITDVYVMCHGWHRNLFSGIGAYDRLISRFSALFSRGRLQARQNYNPLFLTLHWNSDPREDEWVDKCGRRHKVSFMHNVRSLFERVGNTTEAEFINDFEDIFEFLTCLSAPDLDAYDPVLGQIAFQRTEQLFKYEIRGQLQPLVDPQAEKVSLIWRCYFEAENKKFLTSQEEMPRPVGSPHSAVITLVKFAVGIVGIAAILGWLISLLPKNNEVTTSSTWQSIWESLQPVFVQAFTPWNSYRFNHPPAIDVLLGLAIALAIVLGLAFLLWCIGLARAKWGSRFKGFPLISTLIWIVLQLACGIPIIVFLLATFLFRSPIVLVAIPFALMGYPGVALDVVILVLLLAYILIWLGKPLVGIFLERLRDRRDKASTIRDRLAWIARFPIKLYQKCLAADSRINSFLDTLDSQLAFFEMQRKGVDAGQEAGEFIRDVILENGLDNARLHFVGHSFGCLVIANAARELSNTPPQIGMVRKIVLGITKKQNQTANRREVKEKIRIRSLCLVQGALASNWFENEVDVVQNISGSLTCIYSAYDTANAVYYPIANNGRLAAGYVGLCNVGDRKDKLDGPVETIGKGSLFAMIVRQPELVKHSIQHGPPYVFNLDASRIVYDGGIALGGGHDDIFKDDVVNLFWAAVEL